MNERGLDLQGAVDFVGELCKQAIDRFNYARSCLPSWSPQIDRDVDVYADGLANWMVGSLHWSFETERYFGKDGLEVMKTRRVQLLSKSVKEKVENEGAKISGLDIMMEKLTEVC